MLGLHLWESIPITHPPPLTSFLQFYFAHSNYFFLLNLIKFLICFFFHFPIHRTLWFWSNLCCRHDVLPPSCLSLSLNFVLIHLHSQQNTLETESTTSATTTTSTTTMKSTKATSNRPTSHDNIDDEKPGAKSMNSLLHTSPNIYDSDRDIIKHNSRRE